MVLAPVEPFDRLLRRIAGEFPAVKLPDEILRSAPAEIATGIDVDYHHPLGLPFRSRQLEEVRALELARLHTVSLAPGAHIFPLPKVLRGIEAHFLIRRYDHYPFALLLVPEDLGVPEILDTVEGHKDGIALILGEGHAVVQTVRKALRLDIFTLSIVGCIEGDYSPGPETGGIVDVHHRTAGENVAIGVAIERYRLMLPVDHIRAGRMSPVHVAPDAGERIVLIVKMIHTILVKQAVGVVHPAIGRRVMIDGPVFLCRNFRRSIGEGDELPCLRRIYPGEMYVALRCAEMLQIEGHAVICLLPLPGKADVSDIQCLSTPFDGQGHLVVRLTDGNDHIPAAPSVTVKQQKKQGQPQKALEQSRHFFRKLQLSRKS